jgi:hypothetical protein
MDKSQNNIFPEIAELGAVFAFSRAHSLSIVSFHNFFITISFSQSAQKCRIFALCGDTGFFICRRAYAKGECI